MASCFVSFEECGHLYQPLSLSTLRAHHLTDIYEWGWGQSFHFSPAIPGKSHRDATRAHETMIADLLKLKPGQKVLDVGCGVGGPMRAVAQYSQAHVTGITINDYQVISSHSCCNPARKFSPGGRLL